MQEHDALIGFSSRLSHLLNYYGRPNFQMKLNSIISEAWPTSKVIEISPTFMEKALNLVDQEYLRDAIESTVGLDSSEWSAFERVMKRVTFFTGLTENKYNQFTKITQNLIQAIKERDVKAQNLDVKEQDLLRARAATRIANMFIYLERWDIINRDIIDQRASAAGKQLAFTAIGVSTAGLLIASTVYAGPIVATAGALGASFSTDVIVAAQLARLGQIFAGGGMGLAGAPTALLLKNSTLSILDAQRKSLNNGTVYACELDKQFAEWRRQGVSPYMKAALVGGSIGVGGGLLTLTQAGARVILLGTSFGVGLAQVYSLGQLKDNTMRSLAEYRMAMDSHAKGDDVAARQHLQNSRAYAQSAGEAGLEAIVVGVLTVHISSHFKSALIEGEALIRVVFANSSDTLPQALGVAKEAIHSFVK